MIDFCSFTGLASGLNSALGTPYTYGSKGLRLSRSFSGTAGGESFLYVIVDLLHCCYYVLGKHVCQQVG